MFVRNSMEAPVVDTQSELKAVAVEVEISRTIHRFIAAYLLPNKALSEPEFRKIISEPNTIIGGD